MSQNVDLKKERKEREKERFLLARKGVVKIKHPQRRVPSEASDVAAAEKKWK